MEAEHIADLSERGREEEEEEASREGDGGTEEIILSRQDYDALKKLHELVGIPALSLRLSKPICDEDLEVNEEEEQRGKPTSKSRKEMERKRPVANNNREREDKAEDAEVVEEEEDLPSHQKKDDIPEDREEEERGLKESLSPLSKPRRPSLTLKKKALC